MLQFAVIGLGLFGSSVAHRLTELNCQVLAIDSEEENVQDISEVVTQAVTLDATEKNALLAAGIKNTDVAIVAIGRDLEASILVCLLLKEIGIPKVVAKAISPAHANVLDKIGVDKVIFPEKEMGIRVANSLVSPNIIEYINLTGDYSIVDIKTPKSFVNRTIRELDIRKKFNVTVLGIKKKIPHINEMGEEEFMESFNVSPAAEEIIMADDILVVVGRNEDIGKIKNL